MIYTRWNSIFVLNTKGVTGHWNTLLRHGDLLFDSWSSCLLSPWRSVSFRLLQPREKGRMRFHKLQNVQIALDFLKHRQVGNEWQGEENLRKFNM